MAHSHRSNKEDCCCFTRLQRIRVVLIVLLAYILVVQNIYLPYQNEVSRSHSLHHNVYRRAQMTAAITKKKSAVKPPAQRAKPWKRYSPKSTPLPYPIFVTSLPKSGTTSIWKFFKCGGQLASHNWVRKQTDFRSSLAGVCIRDNIRNDRPPFEGCGRYDVFTDTGYIEYDHDTGLDCYFPSVDGLEDIYRNYPNATFLNVVRDATAWYNSLQSWAHGSLFVRFRLCNATGFPHGQSQRDDIIQFYTDHTEMIRQFVADRPSITYLEVSLEAEETGRVLSEATGIEARCWKDCKPDEAECEGGATLGGARIRRAAPTRGKRRSG